MEVVVIFQVLEIGMYLEVLNDWGFATLLVDLLTPQEQDSDIKSQKVIGKFPGIVLNKFNIHLLSH